MLILYTTEDGRSEIRLRAEDHTVRLTQQRMAALFDATKPTISLHLKNIFEDEKLNAGATVKESLTVQTEVRSCPRQQFRQTLLASIP